MCIFCIINSNMYFKIVIFIWFFFIFKICMIFRIDMMYLCYLVLVFFIRLSVEYNE